MIDDSASLRDPLDWRSRTRWWCGPFPIADLAWSGFFFLCVVLDVLFIIEHGPLRWYVIEPVIHLGIAVTSLFRKIALQVAAAITACLFVLLLVVFALTPVNLGINPILLAAPLTLWTVTRWGSGGALYAMLAAAGAVMNPMVVAPPIFGGFSTHRIAPFGVPAVLLVMGCYVLAQRIRTRSIAHHRAVHEAMLHQRIALARELHDVVGHGLTAIKVSAQTAQYVGEPRGALDKIIDLADRSLADVRALVEALNDADPPSIDPAEIPAIVQRCGIAAELPASFEATGSWPLRYRIALVRAVQEISTNALKHGAAPGSLRLRITDSGFHLEAENPLGTPGPGTRTGLRSVEERISDIGSMAYTTTDTTFHIRITVP
ncbi:histidine kinase [Corynebacterium uropygiale]|uniref:histidine kinase n=1 Tax=Corynebacterium uropygiale TaxID=1775911 RepID=A0A9X1QNJ1_9CORY|nr:histidine kinase [Corynebacterium uropygiale]